MSRHLLLIMLIWMINQLKSQSMTSASTVQHQIEDCFYEKHIHTSLNGFNDQHDHWTSEFDCLQQCLKSYPHRCRSFEHWNSKRQGLCVRSNTSLSDQPKDKRINLFVNYYEIDCRKDVKAVRPQIISCPGEQLNIIVSLNGIDPNYVHLGNTDCKPVWSNDTHAQFMTHIDNCSLMLADGSINGKLRWEGVVKDTNEAKQYERFFLCPSDIYRIRLADWTSTTISSRLMSSSSNKFRNSLSTISLDPSRHRLSSTPASDQRTVSTVNRISLEWTARNQTYFCPNMCSMSLYSFIHVTIDEPTDILSNSLLDSCELKVLHPYTSYVPNRPLISRGCSLDPSLIQISSTTHLKRRSSFFFYLYNIFKEPIPFEIHCHLLKNSPLRRNCSTLDEDHFDQENLPKQMEEIIPILYRSSRVDVFRHFPTNYHPPGKTNSLSHRLSPSIDLSALFFFVFFFIFFFS